MKQRQPERHVPDSTKDLLLRHCVLNSSTCSISTPQKGIEKRANLKGKVIFLVLLKLHLRWGQEIPIEVPSSLLESMWPSRNKHINRIHGDNVWGQWRDTRSFQTLQLPSSTTWQLYGFDAMTRAAWPFSRSCVSEIHKCLWVTTKYFSWCYVLEMPRENKEVLSRVGSILEHTDKASKNPRGKFSVQRSV